MKTTRLSSLCLTALLGLSSAGAFADASTGPTNPTSKGDTPGAVSTPPGTGNPAGAATDPAPGNGTSDGLKPQTGGNPEGSSMGGDTTRPLNGVNGIQKGGTGSEGGKGGGASH
ncbi:hypothetical protein [Pseudomonas typographi]|uniref:Lipoprotein n=1 Tax=Pseudomonas typographi TaxID=2715964 RepID=A0ABR7Z0H7_9PSED|nr:hypothetical protein [Pseudomonas typographi]MBD1551280.1 hypothetical protein [Pseudomonas typographi]MBD1598955.1 hypothetical protein [Pseudomonas typographi]